MSVTTDMVAMWRRPTAVVGRLLAMGRREDRALAFLMAASFLTFLAQLPVIQRRTVLATGLEGGDFTRDASYAFMATMLLMPLFFYGLAALGQLGARAFGLRVSGYGGRLALFWAYLTLSPLVLFHGLLSGLNGAGTGTQIVGAIGALALLAFWIIGLRVAGAKDGTEDSHA